MPLTRSRPASIAATSGSIQPGAMKPPEFATPITIARAPAACAWAGVRNGRPVVTFAPSQANSPTQRSGAQSRNPNAVLAYEGSVVSPRNNR